MAESGSACKLAQAVRKLITKSNVTIMPGKYLGGYIAIVAPCLSHQAIMMD